MYYVFADVYLELNFAVHIWSGKWMSVHTELTMLYVFKVSITGCMCLFFCQLKQKQGVYKPAVLEELKQAMLLAEEKCPGITDSMVTGVVQRLKRYFQHPACIAQYMWESDVCFLCFQVFVSTLTDAQCLCMKTISLSFYYVFSAVLLWWDCEYVIYNPSYLLSVHKCRTWTGFV